ncbi:MAG: cytochrome c biogenesis protein CcsA, partial [Saprospiraceae bacterium]|nr:cytochrome c biogenesis protein CcsA [Saprospiraceae bacterium]
MSEIQYIGEHIWARHFGHAVIILQFVAALFGAFAFYKAHKKENQPEFSSWFNLGKAGFFTHGIALFSLIGLLFLIMINQYYEFQYVQAHVSDDLPMRYIFSAFWEGQEGSFMLWMFWHVILGGILLWKGGVWRASSLSVLLMIEAIIGSMLLGVYVPFTESFKIGSSPILLLREVMDAPIFAQADYVSLLNGSGLNPLLQNYWMTIHPPTLFLGFASTAIPFVLAMAGLMRKDYKGWLKPALPWALFSGAILGLGILMGGAWAYEALSFGGYWAWDPVENMSLVPWITLIAGIHCHLVARATGYSIKSAMLFYMATFWLVLYSTFLTRSGVLGDTSVHAFTEMGLENQLLLLIFFFIGIGVYQLVKNWKAIPAPQKEEEFASKEFWMFIGSLVLLFSAILITVSTSLPVFNKIRSLFDPFAEGVVITDVVEHHNKYQLWIAVFIGVLSGFSQYLRFRERDGKKVAGKFWKQSGTMAAIALGLTVLILQSLNATAWQYMVLLWACLFAILTNLDYIIRIARLNIKLASSAFSHLGFAIMIIGSLASGLNKEFLSSNPLVQRNMIEGFTEDDYGKNILLFKGKPMFMKGYEVTYERDTLEGVTRTFEVSYKKLDDQGQPVDSFKLFPNILYTKAFDKIATSNPSTKRELASDVFTHISSLP